MESNEQQSDQAGSVDQVIDSVNESFERLYEHMNEEEQAVVDVLGDTIVELISEFSLESFLVAMHRVMNGQVDEVED